MRRIFLILPFLWLFPLKAASEEKPSLGNSLSERIKSIEKVDSIRLSPYTISRSDLENLRSPFEPLVKPLKSEGEADQKVEEILRYSLEQITLVGVMWSAENPRAMFLLPSKKVYVLQKNEKIGNKEGYISEIKEGQVTVIESVSSRGKRVASKKTLHLKKE